MRKEVDDYAAILRSSLLGTELINAAVFVDSSELRRLLALGANVDARDSNGSTALMVASRHGYLDHLEALLGAGAEPNLTDFSRISALWLAAKYGHTECARLLIGSGANVEGRELRSRTPFTALMVAAQNDHPDMVRLLVEKGAKLDARGARERHSALMVAAMRGSVGCVEALLDADASEDLADSNGWTAKEHAAYWGNASVMRMLAPLCGWADISICVMGMNSRLGCGAAAFCVLAREFGLDMMQARGWLKDKGEEGQRALSMFEAQALSVQVRRNGMDPLYVDL